MCFGYGEFGGNWLTCPRNKNRASLKVQGDGGGKPGKQNRHKGHVPLLIYRAVLKPDGGGERVGGPRARRHALADSTAPDGQDGREVVLYSSRGL